ncbi:MAG: NAD(P)-dependent alcohol dehydrogenase [Spirochaetia bacterium]|nr:NAD(P)-dependent alcohol dehydrogenase [Spirochaetia bacterium]
MKAAIYKRYGPPEVFQLADIEKPKPKNNEILVKIYASTVSAGALLARAGRHPNSRFFTLAIRLIFGLTKPRNPILGFEFSGEVESAGKDTKEFKKGDKIYGTTTGMHSGAYAEYICLPGNRKQGVIASKPENLSDEDAAAVPIGGMTALDLLNKANIEKGQNVLIYGASGSVGTFAVQLAKHHFGAEVTGVCSASNLNLVQSLGADFVIDYTEENFTQNGRTYDVVFDAVGKISSSYAKNSLGKNGKFITVKSPTKEKYEYLILLKELIEKDKIKPVIEKRYPLSQIVEAHRYCDQGHKQGNVIITMDI